MRLQNLIPNLKLKTPNEYCGPCPKCGGEDRFIVFIEKQKFYCRQCNWKGDAIDYLRFIDPQLTFSEAKERAGIETTLFFAGPQKQESRPERLYSEPQEPPETWSQEALKIVEKCHGFLFDTTDGNQHLEWLKNERGITAKSVQRFALGWNQKDLYLPREAWGMPVDKDKKKLFIPSGLIIPTIEQNKVVRLRVRKDRIKDQKESRYHVVAGSKVSWSRYGQKSKIAIIVESDLCGILTSQVTGLTVFATTSATLMPDLDMFKRFSEFEYFMDSGDFDKAGFRGSHKLFKILGKKYCDLPPINGKDVTEMWSNGVSISDWYKAGLQYYELK